jgi:hypothetical protein
MPQISFSPAEPQRYWASAERAPDRPDTIVYGFGTSAEAVISYPVSTAEEPNSFHYFQEHWTRPGDGSRPIDQWVGFMVLRYLCGYRTQWDILAEPLRRQAQRSDSTGSDDDHELVSTIRSWPLGWEEQLQPLVDALHQ